jgi:uncharacterized membrane protein YhiD involved in acid resistance
MPSVASASWAPVIIFRRDREVGRGLTTAARVWGVAAISNAAKR